MLMLIFTTLGWLGSPSGINGLFALLCLAAAMGAGPRPVMLISALLYLALVFV